MTTQAYFLAAHGSRRPQTKRDLNRLADHLRALIIDCPPALVGTGCLEFHAYSLAEQLIQFRASLPSSCRTIHILPVFLLPGNHVRSDIPSEIQIAQAQLQKSNVQLVLTPHLGSHPALKQILLNKMTSTRSEAWIVVGHGSRRPAGNRAIEQLAHNLKAYPAFWANQPSLTEQVKTLIHQGVQSIGIIPYFLFSGKITAAIAEQIAMMSDQYSHVSFELLSSLDPSPEMAAALLDLTQRPSNDLWVPQLSHRSHASIKN